MQPQQQSQLPDFKNPPVNEVVISVEFVPMSRWQSVHAGLYWSSIRGRYPDSETHPLLYSPPDVSGGDIFIQPPPPRFEFVQPDSNRNWFLSGDKTNIIQVQRDRFIVNWRQVLGDELYPRFEPKILPTFQSEFRVFREFINSTVLDKLEITFCEVTYINHLVQGKDWLSLEDAIENFSALCRPKVNSYLPPLETFSMVSSYKMPNDAGRLSVQLAHALRQKDKKQIIQLSLTSRGRPMINSDDDLSKWLLTAREWIVRGFAELTTEHAHKRWGRTR